MKKFMFSAIAMIAFVGSSMASNEIGVESTTRDCEAEGKNAQDSSAPYVDWAIAELIGQDAKDNCEKQTKTGKYKPKTEQLEDLD
jgi:hypothetical protein